MNIGEETVDWLHSEQLRVDDEWSIRTPNGFTWWADKHAQTIEVIGKEIGPDGEIGYLISVRTEFIRNLTLDHKSMAAINAMLMSCASMAGPVYNAKTRTLSLCSLVSVHEGISEWMNPLIDVAAVLQIGEARLRAGVMAKALGVQEAVSGHPKYGIRPEPDKITNRFAFFIMQGQKPCRWLKSEFQDTVVEFMQQSPSRGGNVDGTGFIGKFPYDEQPSLYIAKGDQPHPTYGNGLFLMQSFPFTVTSNTDGVKLALSLNTTELTEKPCGYGFGSYAYRDGAIQFVSFLPNTLHKPGLLPNLFFASAHHARGMTIRLADRDWSAESFNQKEAGTMLALDEVIETGEKLRDALIAKNGGQADQHHAKFLSRIMHAFGHDQVFMGMLLPQANELNDLIVARKYPRALDVLLAFLVLFRSTDKHADSTVDDDLAAEKMTSAEKEQEEGSDVAAFSSSDLKTTCVDDPEDTLSHSWEYHTVSSCYYMDKEREPACVEPEATTRESRSWNMGLETIEWLYSAQLKVDDVWATQIRGGFTWWADKNAQTIEIAGSVKGPEGEPGCLIAVRTELLRDLVLDEKSLAGINAVLMSFASMAGPVYDEDEQTLSLCTLVPVHDDNIGSMKRMLSVAAAVQIGMAGAFATALANTLKCQTAVSGHPEHGIRPEPDDICNLMAFFAREGKGPCRWPRKDFHDAVDKHMQQLPAMRGKAGKLGFTVEFPYGKRESSTCEATGDQPHPVLGNGLFTLQSFPLSGTSNAEGVKLALSLNAWELTEKPTGYGFGSYAFRDGAIHFVNFFPNVTHKAGLLTDLFCASALRAREMSVRLTGSDWTDWTGNPSGPKRSAMGRIKDLFIK